MNMITINNDTNSITITKANNQINIIDVGLQGIRGAKGDKGDKGDTFLYSDLTQQQKEEFANLVELDTSILNTDLQALYILNKD